MRPHREIIQWRAHAPWQNGMQVEQDLLLTMAMVAIFQDPFLAAQVAMRGGTVLHKVHLAPASRYSEDIDLVHVGDRPIGHVRKALLHTLGPILGKPRTTIIADVTLAIRNLVKPSKVLRIEYLYAPTETPPPVAKLKIEVNYTEREPCYDLVDLPYAPPLPVGAVGSVTLRSYDLNEMLGTKMRALRQREQGRDLFDLWWALQSKGNARSGVTLDPSAIVDAFKEYMRREGTRVSRGEFERDLAAKLRRPAFRRAMDGMLRSDFGRYDVDQAGRMVGEELLSRLPT